MHAILPSVSIWFNTLGRFCPDNKNKYIKESVAVYENRLYVATF